MMPEYSQSCIVLNEVPSSLTTSKEESSEIFSAPRIAVKPIKVKENFEKAEEEIEDPTEGGGEHRKDVEAKSEEENKSINAQQQQFSRKQINQLGLTAKSICVFDADTGKSIVNVKAKKPREIASLTKIMTCHVICSAIVKKKMNLSDPVRVSRIAASMIGNCLPLLPNQPILYRDLRFLETR